VSRKSLNELLNPANPGDQGQGYPVVEVGDQGGDQETFFGRAGNAMREFRELVKLMMQFKQMTGGSIMGNQPGQEYGQPATYGQPGQPAGKSSIEPQVQAFLGQFGNTTVEELLSQLGPMTLKQLWGLINAARSRK
jgi:hypothetical protein